MNKFNYAEAGLSLKVLLTFFLLFVAVGYVFGLINIYNNVGFTYTGIVVHYRGEESDPVPAEFAFSKLVQEHHVHLFGLSLLFLVIGYLFTLTNLPEKIKAPFVAAPFLGMFFDFASLWSTVFLSASFGWFSMIFGGFMALSCFMLIGRPLYEMWLLPAVQKTFGESTPWFLK